MRRAASGERSAIEQLIAELRPRSRRIALSVLSDEDIADDIAQEAMLRLRESIADFRGDSDVATWVHRVTMNLAMDHLRLGRRRHALLQGRPAHVAEIPSPEASIDEGRAREALSAAIERLPSDQREVIRLRFVFGLAYTEIASKLGIPQGTVASRVYRALTKLGTYVEPKHLEIIE